VRSASHIIKILALGYRIGPYVINCSYSGGHACIRWWLALSTVARAHPYRAKSIVNTSVFRATFLSTRFPECVSTMFPRRARESAGSPINFAPSRLWRGLFLGAQNEQCQEKLTSSGRPGKRGWRRHAMIANRVRVRLDGRA
jgi:hypothetical protein